MDFRCDFHETVRVARVRIKGWSGFPRYPTNVMLFSPQANGFIGSNRAKHLIAPNLSYLSRNPGMGGLSNTNPVLINGAVQHDCPYLHNPYVQTLDRRKGKRLHSTG